MELSPAGGRSPESATVAVALSDSGAMLVTPTAAPAVAVPDTFVACAEEPCGFAPSAQTPLGARLRWTVTHSSSFLLLVKLSTLILLSGGFYILATLNVWFFLACTVGLPTALYGVHAVSRARSANGEDALFIPEFVELTPLIRIKYFTFTAQNLLIGLAVLHGSDSVMSTLMSWVLRVNVLEVLVDCIARRHLLYLIPSIMLMLTITSASTVTFPQLDMRVHPRFMCLWTPYDPFFIVIYSGTQFACGARHCSLPSIDS
jgi:hypothetical protein